jgi:hypothetical protein
LPDPAKSLVSVGTGVLGGPDSSADCVLETPPVFVSHERLEVSTRPVLIAVFVQVFDLIKGRIVVAVA